MLVGFCFLATFICYIDRVNISVAIIPMAEEFGWSATTKGYVLSSFFVGYLLAMIPVGWAANKFGGKLLLGGALIGWSLFTFLTPIAAGVSLSALLITRVLMGIGEAASFPGVYNLLGRWIPKEEKSRAAAVNLTGIPLGTIFALSTTGLLVAAYGWQSVFYVFGGLGLVFAAIWLRVIHGKPSEHPTISPEEKALLAGLENTAAEDQEPIPWGLFLKHPAIWALFINHFCANWTLYLFLAWLPSYFRDVQGLSIAGSGLFAIGPWVCQFVAGNLSAMVADRWIARGVSVTFVRKFMQCCGLLGGAGMLLLASQATTPGMALFTLCAAFSLASMAWAGFACNHLDVAPKHADVLFSITNIGGTLPGIVGVALTGMLVDLTGGYTATFLVAAGINVFGAVVWLLFATGEEIV
ncbi:MAG: galactarate/glucarate/glycerate transporter GudP [Congregibacter sp.]